VKRAIRELETVDETTTNFEDAHSALRLAMRQLEQAEAMHNRAIEPDG
jgi:hypothetical protein